MRKTLLVNSFFCQNNFSRSAFFLHYRLRAHKLISLYFQKYHAICAIREGPTLPGAITVLNKQKASKLGSYLPSFNRLTTLINYNAVCCSWLTFLFSDAKPAKAKPANKPTSGAKASRDEARKRIMAAKKAMRQRKRSESDDVIFVSWFNQNRISLSDVLNCSV